MYRVFLSYNTTPDEMVVVWRLQTLAAASGLHLDVPNPIQRSDWAAVTQMIGAADSVIAFLTKHILKAPQVITEINYALSLGKPVVPIVEQGASLEIINSLSQRSGTYFVLDTGKPGEMERETCEVSSETEITIKILEMPFSLSPERSQVCSYCKNSLRANASNTLPEIIHCH